MLMSKIMVEWIKNKRLTKNKYIYGKICKYLNYTSEKMNFSWVSCSEVSEFQDSVEKFIFVLMHFSLILKWELQYFIRIPNLQYELSLLITSQDKTFKAAKQKCMFICVLQTQELPTLYFRNEIHICRCIWIDYRS